MHTTTAHEIAPVKKSRSIDTINSTLADLARLSVSGRPCVATFEVPGNKRAWVQVTDKTLNVSYPYEMDPAEWLPVLELNLPDGMRMVGWKPHVFIEFAYTDPAPLARLIHTCFTVLLKQEGDAFPLVANTVQL